MFEIRFNDDGDVLMIGRCDAAQEVTMGQFFAQITETKVLDCKELQYVSSSGLGIIFATQQALRQSKQELVIANLSPHLREVFKIAGFDVHFKILPPEDSPTS